jgi:hypothetical protein
MMCLVMAKEERPILPREELFVEQYMLNGGNATRALLALEPDMTYGAAASTASVYLDRPRVREAIRKAMEGSKLLNLDEMRQLFERWIFSEDGDVAHKWLALFLKEMEPQLEGATGPKELHQHAHIHFEGMSENMRKFILVNKRYPTKEETMELEASE